MGAPQAEATDAHDAIHKLGLADKEASQRAEILLKVVAALAVNDAISSSALTGCRRRNERDENENENHNGGFETPLV